MLQVVSARVGAQHKPLFDLDSTSTVVPLCIKSYVALLPEQRLGLIACPQITCVSAAARFTSHSESSISHLCPASRVGSEPNQYTVLV